MGRQLGRRGRALHTGAAVAGVAVDEHVDLGARGCERARETVDHRRRVGDDRDADVTGESREPLGLAATEERVGQHHVLQARLRHHLGLAELLAGDPRRPGLHLCVGELRQLVGLHMGTQGEIVLVAVRLQRRDVALDAVEVDDQRRRLELVDPHQSSSATTASISTSNAVKLDWIVVRAGYGFVKNAR